YNDFCNSHVSAALSAQDSPRQHSRKRGRGAAVTFERVIHPSRTARRHLIARPCWRAPTDACDESCAAAATPTQIVSTGCAQQLCLGAGPWAWIAAADAKPYDSGVT